MSTSFKVKVDSNFEFDLTETDIQNINALATSNQKYHVIHDHLSYHVKILEGNFHKKEYTISVNDNNYRVNIHNILDLQIADMGFSIGSTKQINAIKAPMPGLLLDIQIKTGQEVQENDPLLILEAMKMENVIVSPRAGIIKTIAITKGDAVDKGQLLIEFE